MASQILSLPNCLCCIMILAVIIHVITRDATTRVVQEVDDGLEVVYCKFPQSIRQEESHRCLSIRGVFVLLAIGCSYQEISRGAALKTGVVKEQEESIEDLKEPTVTKESTHKESVGIKNDDEKREKVVGKKDKEEMSSLLVDLFVVGVLILSASISLMEWHKERNKNAEQNVGGEGQPPEEGANNPVNNRRFSLVDLTVNRHIRRKEAQQHQQHPPVVRQGSTSSVGRSGSQPPPLIRRSSFPAQLPEVRSRQPPQRQQSHPGVPPSRRMSVDFAEDDSSPDRRRVRIIRRH